MPFSNDAPNPMPSRRRLLQGVTALAVPIPSLGETADPALGVAKRWCWLEAEQSRLIYQWQGWETWLFAHRDWPRLSKAERAAVPEGAHLRAIDDQLDQIDKFYDALLPVLKTTSATTREGLFAKFEALLHFVVKDENPDARAILSSCLLDLERLWQ
jgi:hypothetical protein